MQLLRRYTILTRMAGWIKCKNSLFFIRLVCQCGGGGEFRIAHIAISEGCCLRGMFASEISWPMHSKGLKQIYISVERFVSC